MDLGIRGRRAIVCASSQGLGRACARALAEAGVAVIVNGRKKEAPGRVLTFMQVVALAFDPVPSGPDWVFTVTYRKAARKPHEGTLTEGETVAVRNGTIFNVTATNKS